MNIEDRAMLRDRYANHVPTLLALAGLVLGALAVLYWLGR